MPAPPQRADNSPELDRFVRRYTSDLIKQGRNQTAFGETARWGHLPLLEQFIAEGYEIDGRTEYGYTPLMLAASGGHQDIVRRLIDAGADVNAVDDRNGMTPLMWNLAAVHSGDVYLSISRELLRAGADVTIISKDGKTALDWARERRNAELIDLLSPP